MNKVILLQITALAIMLSCGKVNNSQSNKTISKKKRTDSVLTEPTSTREPSLLELLVKRDTTTFQSRVKVEIKTDFMEYFLTDCMLWFSLTDQNHYRSEDSPAPDIVKFLLRLGANPNTPIVRSLEASPDYYLVNVTCDPPTGELLIEYGSKLQLNEFINCAVEKKDKEGIRQAIKRGGDPTYALAYACDNDRELFNELLSQGADKDVALRLLILPLLKQAKYYHPYQYGYSYAIEQNDKELYLADVVHEIVNIGDYKTPVNNRLHYISNGNKSSLLDTTIIKELAFSKTNPNISLPLAVLFGMNELLDSLMQKGADINYTLFFAAEIENADLIKDLTSKGAKLERRSRIAFSKNEELKSLISVINGKIYSEATGVNDAEDSPSAPPQLFKAIYTGDYSAINFMLKAGANPNQGYGERSLFDYKQDASYYSRCGSFTSIEVAAIRAERFLEDADKTQFTKCLKIIKLLQKYGAKWPNESCKPEWFDKLAK